MRPFQDNSLFAEFLSTYSTPTTKATVRRVIKSFIDFTFGDAIECDFSIINSTKVLNFIAEKNKSVVFTTSNQYLTVIKSFCRYLYIQDVISPTAKDHIQAIRPIKGSRPPAGRALKTREIEKIKSDYSVSNKAIDIRDFAIFALAAYSGIRRCEASRIDIKDIDGTTISIKGKGNKHRTIYLSKFAEKALKRWLSESKLKNGALFRGVGRWGNVTKHRLGVDGIGHAIRRIEDKTNSKHFTSHDLRRTFATSLLDNNADVFVVQKLMGHASIDTTQIYDRRAERVKKQAMKLLPY